MARQLTKASTQYLQVADHADFDTGARDFTWACRVYADALGTNLIACKTNTSAAGEWQCFINASGNITFETLNGGGTTQMSASLSGVISTATWHTIIGWYDATTELGIDVDGTSATDTTMPSDPTTNALAFTLGSYSNGAFTWDGRIAEFAWWADGFLSASDRAALVDGVSPLLVRPDIIVEYWPLWGRHDPEIGLVGGHQLTLVNGPTTGAHPRVIYPSQRKIFVPSSAAAFTLTAEKGTFTLSGKDAGLTAARKLTADAGSFTLTGKDATLTHTPVAGGGGSGGGGPRLKGAREPIYLPPIKEKKPRRRLQHYVLAAEPGHFALRGCDSRGIFESPAEAEFRELLDLGVFDA